MNKLAKKQGFSRNTKFGIVAGVVAVFLAILFVSGVFGDATFNLTLTSNDALERNLSLHYTFDGSDLIVPSEAVANVESDGDVAVDTSVDTNMGRQTRNTSPTTVWINDTEGFVFFMDAGVGASMASTSDGGATWGNLTDIDSVNGTDGIKIAVWYDQWTPGDTTGTKIHIATFDNGADDTFYTEYDTITNALSTTILTGTEAGSVNISAHHSITKVEDGTLYVTLSDDVDGWVHECTSSCTTAVNWGAITNPWSSAGNDFTLLMPVAGTDNVMLIGWDISANDLESNIYSATSSSWWGWDTNIEQDEAENTNYFGSTMGATLNRSTGEIYFAYCGDCSGYSTQIHDIRFWEFDNSTFSWTQQTDVVTDASGGVTEVKLVMDENTGDIYAVYGRRITINDDNTVNYFYRKTTDNGTTWSSESAAFTDLTGDFNGLQPNIMSDERIGFTWVSEDSPNQDDIFYINMIDLVPGGTGTSTDRIGGVDGTISAGSVVAPGRLGQGIELDGVDDHIEVASPGLPTGDFTLAAWIYPHSVSDNDPIKAGNSGGGNELGLRLGGGNFEVVVDGDTHDSEQAIDLNTWTHIAGTRSGSTVNMYVNGALASSTTDGGTMDFSTCPLFIGADVDDPCTTAADSFFDGRIDDVRVYSAALSADEMRRLYELGATTRINKTITTNDELENGLVGHWTFDGKDLVDNAVDRSGSANIGYLVGFTSTTTAPGRIGQALDFDGTDDYVDAGSASSLADLGPATWSAWIMRTSSTDYGPIMYKSDGNTDEGWWIDIRSNNGGEIGFGAVHSSSNLRRYTTSLPTVGEWAHMLVTWDGNTSSSGAHVYLDGVEQSYSTDDNGDGTHASDSTRSFFIGEGDSGVSSFFTGRIDDARVYNRVLSTAEISRLYGLGATTRINTSISTNPDLKNGLIGHWTFDGKNMYNNAADTSGQGNNGYLTNFTSTTTKPGKFGQALDLDGSNDYVVVTSTSDFTDVSNGISVAAWFRTDQTSTDTDDYIFSKGRAATDIQYGLFIDSSDGFDVGFTTNDGDFDIVNSDATGYNDGEWHHAVGIFDGTNNTLYVDGVLQSGSTAAGTPSSDSTDLVLGTWNGDDTPSTTASFLGSLDDLRIYSRVLSASEVSRLYEIAR